MKVRITATPHESEIDGVHLDLLNLGSVRDVSPSIASWLVASGYAEPEMRHSSTDDDEFGGSRRHHGTEPHRRRRSTD